MYASGRQNVDQGDAPLHSHCCKLHTQASLGSDSSHSSQQHSTVLRWQPSPPFQASLCDAVQAVVAVKVRLRVARRHAHSMHLRNGMGQVVSVEVPVASS
jgi:hypothetical protein